MAATGDAHGNMDISDQRGTFHSFLVASLWGSTHVAQLVALLTLAFAMNLGWWPGFAAYVVIGVAVGLMFKQTSVFWAVQIASWVLLALGGLIVPALSGMMG
ncbi:MAG: aa3-type cytochrome c oxidase subunit IV [Hyphomonadaceae bacterium]|nr:aa3-type cytochrome c oxidase subunit IV [Hyphomonadaceae bacterium]